MPETSSAKHNADLISALKLTLVPDLGPRTYHALMDRFGSAGEVLAARYEELMEVPRVGKALALRIGQAAGCDNVDDELDLCRQRGVQIVSISDATYPRLLREIHDPPPLLYMRGAMKPSDALAIAIVGARRATLYGRQQAERLGGLLAGMGFTIVSGLARGIDAAAHRGALAAGGRTIAVLAGGLADVYPPEHKDLADQVAAAGAVISEVPMRQEPLPNLFPRRNRIISGLSLGVLVVEAGKRSGALITARHAAEQGREVFALPGRIDNLASQGTNMLIQDGARLVACVEDIVDELGPLVQPAPRPEDAAGGGGGADASGSAADPAAAVRHPAELMLDDVQRRVLEQIPADPVSADAIITSTGLPAGKVVAALTHLEMRHLIHRLPGSQYCRA